MEGGSGGRTRAQLRPPARQRDMPCPDSSRTSGVWLPRGGAEQAPLGVPTLVWAPSLPLCRALHLPPSSKGSLKVGPHLGQGRGCCECSKALSGVLTVPGIPGTVMAWGSSAGLRREAQGSSRGPGSSIDRPGHPPRGPGHALHTQLPAARRPHCRSPSEESCKRATLGALLPSFQELLTCHVPSLDAWVPGSCQCRLLPSRFFVFAAAWARAPRRP